MSATRIAVEWMTEVPELDDGDCRFDHATWAFKGFESMAKARAFAAKEAKRNKWGQVWIKTEHAPHDRAPDWQWETDHDATEIVEAA